MALRAYASGFEEKQIAKPTNVDNFVFFSLLSSKKKSNKLSAALFILNWFGWQMREKFVE